MIFIVIGLICAAGGIGLLVLRRSHDDRLLEVKATKQLPASTLQDLSREIREQIGPGGFSQLAEVKGIVESDKPLTSELAEKPCVWYRSRVDEEYEETVHEESADGSRRTHTKRASETISNNTRSHPFLVRDESGTVLVDPEDARIESETILDRQEPYHDERGEIRLGAFSFRPSSGRRVLGYRYREEAIPLGSKIYVIGEACDRVDETLCIRKPSDKTKPFIVSVRSEEQIIESMEKKSAAKKWIGLVLLTLGILGILSGVVDIVS